MNADMIEGDGTELPAEFIDGLTKLEGSYCSETDPIRQSGFGGGPERWRAEREPILEAVDSDGDFLDIGCANGHLLECLVAWAERRGYRLVPHGLDVGPRLVALAKRRFPDMRPNFHVGNAWGWQPPRRYRYVYSLLDCVPDDYLPAYLRRVLDAMVRPDGRLIVGEYGSRSRGTRAADLRGRLCAMGFTISGTSIGGDPPVSSFAWIDARQGDGE